MESASSDFSSNSDYALGFILRRAPRINSSVVISMFTGITDHDIVNWMWNTHLKHRWARNILANKAEWKNAYKIDAPRSVPHLWLISWYIYINKKKEPLINLEKIIILDVILVKKGASNLIKKFQIKQITR